MPDVEDEVFEPEAENNRDGLITPTTPVGSQSPSTKKTRSKKRPIIILIIIIVMIVWLLAIGIGVGLGIPFIEKHTTDELVQSNRSGISSSDLLLSSENLTTYDPISNNSLITDQKSNKTTHIPHIPTIPVDLEANKTITTTKINDTDITTSYTPYKTTTRMLPAADIQNVTAANSNTTVSADVTTSYTPYRTTTEVDIQNVTAANSNTTVSADITTSYAPYRTTTKVDIQNVTASSSTTVITDVTNSTGKPEQTENITTASTVTPTLTKATTVNNIKKRNNTTVRVVTVGAVAADHGKCSRVGRDILDIGGSSVDSAIATLLCNGIMQPHSMGIGGGCFMVIYDKQNGSVDVINGREIAPEAATYNKYYNQSFTFGPLSVAVPGEIMVYWAAHQKYGKLPWKDLFKPSIKMAKNGSPLSASAARGLRIIKSRLRRDFNTTLQQSYPDLCKIYCDNNGDILQKDKIIYRPKFGETLQGIADEGPDYLYKGEGAKRLIQDMAKFNGLITLQDLDDYKLRNTPTLSYRYGNVTMYTLGAPSGGPVFGLILKVLEGFNFTSEDLSSPEKEADMYHKMIESYKFVYADRLRLGDPVFVDIEALLNRMTSTKYAEFLRSKIDLNGTHNTSYYSNITGVDWESHGTTHISILGPNGDAVAVTSTINYYFGSLLYSPSTGIILNNEMVDFKSAKGVLLNKLKSQSANYVSPKKMPLSSMAPAIFIDDDGEVVLVLGASGGARITTVNAQVAARVLWLKQTVKEAIEELRFHHQLFPNQIIFEQNFPKNVMEILHKKYGHSYTERTTYMAVVQGVARSPITGDIQAFSDKRKHGKASLLQRNVTIHV